MLWIRGRLGECETDTTGEMVEEVADAIREILDAIDREIEIDG